MKIINLNLALIAIKVLSLSEEHANMATIEFAYAEARADGQAKKWQRMKLENIFITGRAKANLLNIEKIGMELNTGYCSVNISKDAKQNPFCLMVKHRVDNDGKSQRYFYLKCVEENGSYTKTTTMPDGEQAVRRIWRPNKPDFSFVRYVNMYDDQKEYHDKQVAKLEEATA